MRKLLAVALFLSFVLAAAQNAAPAKKTGGGAAAAAKSRAAQAGPSKRGLPSAAGLRCEQLPPFYRSDATMVLQEKIGPNEASTTGNSFFMMPHPVKYVVV